LETFVKNNQFQYIIQLDNLRKALSGKAGKVICAQLHEKLLSFKESLLPELVEKLWEERVANVKSNLVSLHNSCREGEDGEWDCTTDEGKKGFDAMADDVICIFTDLDISAKFNHKGTRLLTKE
jgi:hypothetical protein